MRTKLATITLLLTLAPGLAAGSTYLDSLYGTPSDGGNARSLAMGSVGVSALLGSSASFQNPALLALHGDGLMLDLLVGVQQVNEDRLVPLYDTFGSFVAETAFAVNRNTYGFGEGGAMFRLPLDTPVTVASGLYERYDFAFDYHEEVRDPDPAFEDGGFRDEIIQFHQLNTGGQLRAWSTAIGAEAIPGVNIGFGVQRMFGSYDSVRRVTPVDVGNGAPPATFSRFSRDLTGWGFTVGGQARVYERSSLGVSFEGPFTVDGEHRTLAGTTGAPAADPDAPAAGSYKVKYPGALTFGGTFTPRNELRTTVTLQATRRFWENLTDGYFDEVDRLAEAGGGEATERYRRDTWDIRLGVEHIFYNGTPLRFGFRHVEHYLSDEVYRSVFSLGVGHMVGDVHVDFAAQYHRQSSQQRYLFDPSVGQFTGPANINEVQDSVVNFIVGVSRGI